MEGPRRSVCEQMFQEDFVSLHDVLRTNEILTVFEPFIFENIKERAFQAA